MQKIKLFILTHLHYAIFALIPLTFFCIHNFSKNEVHTPNVFQLYTSIKSSNKSSVSFNKNEKKLYTWNLTNKSYKQVDYSGYAESNNKINFALNIHNTLANDTISFLALNVIYNNEVYTLNEDQFNLITVSQNGKIIIKNHQLQVVIPQANQNTALRINNPSLWQINSISHAKKIYTIGVFFIFLLFVLIVKPSLKATVITTLTTILAMMLFYYFGKETDISLHIKNDNPIKGLAIYYNYHSPTFDEEHSKIFNTTSTEFITQIDSIPSCFLRIDFPNTGAQLSNFKLHYNVGVLGKTWKLNEVKPYYIVGNDIDIKNGAIVLNGADSYLTIGSSYFNDTIAIVNFIRQYIWLLFGLIIFITALLITKKTSTLKTIDSILILFFFVFIFSQLLYFIVNGHRSVLKTENRITTAFPKYDTLSTQKYAVQLDDFFNDQLQVRGKFTALNNNFRYSLFNKLSTSKLVHFGKNGWLFDGSEKTKTIYENKKPYTLKELEQIALKLQQRKNWLDSLNIKYYLIFPPMPHHVYPENIGDELIVRNKETQLHQVLSYLKKHTDITVIDIETPILLAKNNSNKDVYYSVDTHWNYYGAFVAYVAIIKKLQVDFPNIKNPLTENEVNWNTLYNEEGDLAKLVSLNHQLTRKDYYPAHPNINNAKKIINTSSVGYAMSGPILTYDSTDSLAPKMLMFRDSYANNLIPFLSTHFSQHSYVWSTLFYPKIIISQKPNLVITEMMESTINELLKENPPLNTIK